MVLVLLLGMAIVMAVVVPLAFSSGSPHTELQARNLKPQRQ